MKSICTGAFCAGRHSLPDIVLTGVIERKTAAHRLLIEDRLPLFPGVVTFVKAAARKYPWNCQHGSPSEIDFVLERAKFEFGILCDYQCGGMFRPATGSILL